MTWAPEEGPVRSHWRFVVTRHLLDLSHDTCEQELRYSIALQLHKARVRAVLELNTNE